MRLLYHLNWYFYVIKLGTMTELVGVMFKISENTKKMLSIDFVTSIMPFVIACS